VGGNIEFDSEGNTILVLSPLGGNALLVINNELTFPLWGPLGGAVFSDTGNVFARIRDFTIGSMTETVGLGLMLKKPVVPIGFDYGLLVVNRPSGVSRSHKHFTVGQAF